MARSRPGYGPARRPAWSPAEPGRSRTVTGPRPGWRPGWGPGRGPAGARLGPGLGLASLRPSGLSSLAGRWVYKVVTRVFRSLSALIVVQYGRIVL